MSLSAVFILIVALIEVCLPDQEVYVTAYPIDPYGTPCPVLKDDNVLCEPFSFYLNQTEQYFVNNTIFHFMNGFHHLPNRTVKFVNTYNITLEGNGNTIFHENVARSSSVLECNEKGIGGIMFSFSESIQISEITIMDCSSFNDGIDSGVITSFNASLAILNSKDVILEGLSVQNGMYNGLFIDNTSNITVLDCSFYNNSLNDDSSWNMAVQFHEIPDYVISSDWHLNIHSTNISLGSFGGLLLVFFQQKYAVDVNIFSSKLTMNSRNLAVYSDSACNFALLMDGIECSHSSIEGFRIHHQTSCPNVKISIRNSIFKFNLLAALFITWIADYGYLTISSTNFTANLGRTIIIYQPRQLSRQSTDNELQISFTDLRFEGNIYSFTAEDLTVIDVTVGIHGIHKATITDCTFSDNVGSGLSISDSIVIFEGLNKFYNNSATLGGALVLSNNGYLIFKETSKLLFMNNHAQIGGAIFVQQYIARIFEREGSRGFYANCFYLLEPSITESPAGLREIFVFWNNSAVFAGSAVYASITDNCFSLTAMQTVGTDLFVNISVFNNQPGDSVISSASFGVCFCSNETVDCLEQSKSFRGFPGYTLNFSVVTVGNKNGVTPGIVQIRNKRSSKATEVPSRCTYISFSIQVENSSIVNDIINVTAITENAAISNILTINVTVLQCPEGYKLSEDSGTCQCESKISNIAICLDMTPFVINRTGSVWVGFDDELNCTVASSNCPFDYCQFSMVSVSLSEPDTQCANNRVGRLCGACAEGKSLVFGSNVCDDCHNNAHVLKIILFALAGIGLVFLLFLLNLTVSVGTINSLVFFANVVKIYEPLFTSRPIPFLSQFISWINLDVGIKTCFYYLMEGCGKQGLQFVFPFYLWIIILTIIIVSKYSNKVARLIGSNGIPVLATLLLLSFTKLLRTVILVFSISYVDCDGETLLYWYLDPTLHYLQGCHGALFVFALLVLLLLIAPYTLFFFLYPLLSLSKTKVRQRLSWFQIKLKPFFDAYSGPYSIHFCYWPGVLLIVRIVLALVVAIIDNSNACFTLLLSVSLLLIGILSSSKIYGGDHFHLHSLDIAFLIGLAFLAYIFNWSYTDQNSLLLKYGEGVIVSLSGVIFLVILVYHLVKLSAVRAHTSWLSEKIKAWRASKNSTEIQSKEFEEMDFDAVSEMFCKPIKSDFSKYRESMLSGTY